MPFTKHIIEPNNISQCPLPPGEPNELECISNLTLANVIRQLSSLGQHAGRIFDELVQEAVKVNSRSQLLAQRIDNLKQKVSQLDIQNEEVTLDDCQTKKQFKNIIKIDQQVVSRKTMPDAMRIMYENADPPPALDQLNSYRDDGKDCMKFYTDPGFFFNIWCNELIKDNEARKKAKKRSKSGGDKQNLKSPQQNKGHETTHPEYQQQQGHPQFRLDLDAGQNHLIQAQIYNKQLIYAQKQSYADYNDASFPPPPVIRPDMNNYQVYAESNQMNNGSRSSKLVIQQAKLSQQSDRPGLPPPPIPDNNISDLQQMQQQMMRKFDRVIAHNEDPHDLNSDLNCDLPPPPSPPNFSDSNYTVNFAQKIASLTLTQKVDQTDSVFDMPLPPPPDLHPDSLNLPPPISPPVITTINKSMGNHPPLPPPPPLPPLVESDTTSSTSSLSATNTSSNGKPIQEETQSSRSFLDDINKRRFVLKPTNKNSDDKKNGRSNSGRESIQPFVNNSDVAAIIDFVRKFRPHVRDSSDDEENSDWDE